VGTGEDRPTRRAWRIGRLSTAALAATVLLVGSGGSGSASSFDTRSQSASPSATAKQTYLSLGDSYAAGYQPPVKGKKGITGEGYADLIPEKAQKKGYDLDLVNFACGGATVESMANDIGCTHPLPGAPVYKHQTQLDAALAYLADHPGKVQLITVEIGGNDVTSCAKSAGDAIKCVTDAVARIDASLTTTLAKLRTAAGPDTTIVGLTYPDVVLGSYLSKDPAARQLAGLSVVAFQQLINPTLRKRYEAINATFVDVTEATGAYTPLTQTTTLKPYGEIPVAVAKVCVLSYYCTVKDIHATSKGYALIADLVVDAIPAA
jgi:lysophospholipase L1-like esterase